jgi:hypothetical protein
MYANVYKKSIVIGTTINIRNDIAIPITIDFL